MAAKPRDVFFMTLSNALLIDMPGAQPDYPAVLQSMEDIEVHVLERGSPIPPATPVYATIYQSGDPAQMAQGPTSSSGAKIPDTSTNNPFRTGASGNIEFWAEGPQELDIYIHDTRLPNRVSDRTFGWNATAVGDASVPTSMLVPDGGITLGMLADEIKRQMTQIGEVIDWWRPPEAPTMQPPAGFVVCLGQSVAKVDHDFPAPGAINVPDLRNRFILGADATKAHATGANLGNASTDAPGIGGSGGSNAEKDLSHGHGVPGVSHVHYVRVPDHLHSVGSFYTGSHSHSVSGSTGGEYQGSLGRQTGSGTCAPSGHTHGVSGTAAAVGNLGVYGASGAADRGLFVNSDGPNVSLNTATNSTTWTSDPGIDMRPRFYGLLKIMKVKRS